MNITELIKLRRATSPKFIGRQEIPDEVVWQLLANANWAPNHKQTEPWRFKVFTGQAKQELSERVYSVLTGKINEDPEINLLKVENLKANIEKVPVVILVVMQRGMGMQLPEWEEVAAVSMAVQNMWLTATELGLGALWATPPFLKHLETTFKLNENQKFMGFFFVGKVAMELPAPGRGEIQEKVEWNPGLNNQMC